MAGFFSPPRCIVIVTCMFAMVAVVPAQAVAHDPDCIVASHFGPARVHLECAGPPGSGDESNCVLSSNVGLAHVDLACDDDPIVPSQIVQELEGKLTALRDSCLQGQTINIILLVCSMIPTDI